MSGRLHLALLRAAALLVPGPDRAEWLAEWRSELWYLRQCKGAPVTAFCLGAYKDALWLRRNNIEPLVHLQSPWQCLSFLATLAALSIFFAFRLAEVREMLFPPPYAEPQNLATIWGVPVAGYRVLANGTRNLAFYRPVYANLQAWRARGAGLAILQASRNLFDLLGIPVAATVDPPAAALILTRTTWRDYFDSDPNVVGRRLTIAGQPAQVTAVISDRVWRLPGHADAWLLVDERNLAPHDEPSRGFVLTRRSGSGRRIAVPNPEGGFAWFRWVAVPEPRPILATLLMVALACVLLPSVTTLSLGEYSVNRHVLSSSTKMRRWVFLALKIALVLPITVFGSLDLLSLIAVNMQAHAVIVSCVIGFRWVLMDQRSRCPVCLRILSNPTSIGQPSHTFLEWYGTELVCARGHGLLHVPEIANSYSTSRWVHLDSSWSSLF